MIGFQQEGQSNLDPEEAITIPLRSQIIAEQMLELNRNAQLSGNIRVKLSDSDQQLYLDLILDENENIVLRIELNFPNEFPAVPPQFRLLNYRGDIESLDYLKVGPRTILEQIQCIYKHFTTTVPTSLEEEDKQRKRNNRKNAQMNGCSDKELTETKNLNRHFRSKIREVFKDLTEVEQIPKDSVYLEKLFLLNRFGFDEIRQILRDPWLGAEVRAQMHSGRFLHKILRAAMGLKSKKLMIKYYHVMLAAADDPNGFVRWKYPE